MSSKNIPTNIFENWDNYCNSREDVSYRRYQGHTTAFMADILQEAMFLPNKSVILFVTSTPLTNLGYYTTYAWGGTNYAGCMSKLRTGEYSIDTEQGKVLLNIIPPSTVSSDCFLARHLGLPITHIYVDPGCEVPFENLHCIKSALVIRSLQLPLQNPCCEISLGPYREAIQWKR